jgi:hypothetical protein
MVMKIFVADHFVGIIEIDRDKKSIVHWMDDNNIVEKDEYVENMLLFHQQITKTAKMKTKIIFLFIKLNE